MRRNPRGRTANFQNFTLARLNPENGQHKYLPLASYIYWSSTIVEAGGVDVGGEEHCSVAVRTR
jgi:hypothetical protein